MNNKEIDRFIHLTILQEPSLYNVAIDGLTYIQDVSLNDAKSWTETLFGENKSISSSNSYPKYSTDLNCALKVVQRLSQYHFVLTCEAGVWEANFGTATEHWDGLAENPAKAICLAAIELSKTEMVNL